MIARLRKVFNPNAVESEAERRTTCAYFNRAHREGGGSFLTTRRVVVAVVVAVVVTKRTVAPWSRTLYALYEHEPSFCADVAA